MRDYRDICALCDQPLGHHCGLRCPEKGRDPSQVEEGGFTDNLFVKKEQALKIGQRVRLTETGLRQIEAVNAKLRFLMGPKPKVGDVGVITRQPLDEIDGLWECKFAFAHILVNGTTVEPIAPSKSPETGILDPAKPEDRREPR